MDKAAQTIALRDINLSLSGNRLVGILGPSGSGKSSLLYCMAGLRKPTSGEILFEGKSYGNMSSSHLAMLRRSDFGFIFQRHFLIDYMNILDNVLTPVNASSKKMKEKALGLLSRLGIEDLAYKKTAPALRRPEAESRHRPRPYKRPEGHIRRRADGLARPRERPRSDEAA